MTNKYTPTSIDELRIRAQELGLRISLNGGKWYVINSGTTIVAKEQSERMALACAIARTEAGVFDETESK
jgi:hypothetical protein